MPEKKRVTQAEMYEAVQELSATSLQLKESVGDLVEQQKSQSLILWGDVKTGHKGEMQIFRDMAGQVTKNTKAIGRIRTIGATLGAIGSGIIALFIFLLNSVRNDSGG